MRTPRTLGSFQQLAMLAVARLADEAYSVAILEEIESTARRAVKISTVYVTLDRLESRGLVRSWMGPPTAIRGGKARRLYELTPRGAELLWESRKMLDRMWAGLDSGSLIPSR